MRPPGPGADTSAAVGCVLLAAVLFGTIGVTQAMGPPGTTPLGVGAARLLVGGLGFVAVLLLTGRAVAAITLGCRLPGLCAGACTALYQVSFFEGVDRAGVSVGTLLSLGSAPLFVGLAAWIAYRRRPSRYWAAATGVCIVGLFLLSSRGLAGGELTGSLFALASGLAYAAYTMVGKRMLDAGAPPAEVMGVAFGLGGLLLAPLLLTQPVSWLSTSGGVALAAYLGLATTTLAYLLFGRGLTVLGSAPVTTLTLAEPLVATVLAVLLLGEQFSLPAATGAVLVLGGLVLQALHASPTVEVRAQDQTPALQADTLLGRQEPKGLMTRSSRLPALRS